MDQNEKSAKELKAMEQVRKANAKLAILFVSLFRRSSLM